MFTATLVAATLALLPDGGEQHRCTLTTSLGDGTEIEIVTDCKTAERAELAASYSSDMGEFCALFLLLGSADDMTLDRQSLRTSFGF